MPDEVLKTLLECGVHFGHQTRRWNPKMKKFIFGERSGIYIIDLEKTKECLQTAHDYVRTEVAKGGTMLFVGTKKQAKDVIAAEAVRSGMPYINNRWMGGLLTNFGTVRKSIDKLVKIEKMAEDGTFDSLKKKEVAALNKERDKLLRDLGGIRNMIQLPDIVFIVDPKREEIAVKEANKLHIPIIGLIDTNCDPDSIDYPVPGNDDALKSIRYIASVIASAIIEGKNDYAEAKMIQAQKDVPEKVAEVNNNAQEGSADNTEESQKEEQEQES